MENFSGKPNFRGKHGIHLDAFWNCSAFCSKVFAKKPNAHFKTNCIEEDYLKLML
jgi:hypothetical protein